MLQSTVYPSGVVNSDEARMKEISVTQCCSMEPHTEKKSSDNRITHQPQGSRCIPEGNWRGKSKLWSYIRLEGNMVDELLREKQQNYKSVEFFALDMHFAVYHKESWNLDGPSDQVILETMAQTQWIRAIATSRYSIVCLLLLPSLHKHPRMDFPNQQLIGKKDKIGLYYAFIW